MNTLEEGLAVLQDGGYAVALPDQAGSIIHFEDDCVLGFVSIHSSVETMLNSWHDEQDHFVRSQSVALERDVGKAWNVYSVFLCPEAASGMQLGQTNNVEEDFHVSRKIMRASIASRADVQNALLPLLPIQARVQLPRANVLNRIRDELRLVDSRLEALLDGASIDDVVASLLHES